MNKKYPMRRRPPDKRTASAATGAARIIECPTPSNPKNIASDPPFAPNRPRLTAEQVRNCLDRYSRGTVTLVTPKAAAAPLFEQSAASPAGGHEPVRANAADQSRRQTVNPRQWRAPAASRENVPRAAQNPWAPSDAAGHEGMVGFAEFAERLDMTLEELGAFISTTLPKPTRWDSAGRWWSLDAVNKFAASIGKLGQTPENRDSSESARQGKPALTGTSAQAAAAAVGASERSVEQAARVGQAVRP